MKISDAKSQTSFFEEFDTILEKFDKVLANKMPTSQNISLLKQVAHADKRLSQACTAVRTIVSHGIVTTYEKYMENLVSYSEIIEASVVNNSKRKVNTADTHFMESYLSEDSYYDEASELVAFMGDRGDVDSIQNILGCNQALCDGKPKPKQKLRRERKPT